MNKVWERLAQLGSVLPSDRMAVIGGLAVSVRTEPRFTRDVDVAVAVTDDREAERIVRRFIAEGEQLSFMLEQESKGRIAMARLVPSGGIGVAIDLLFASSGIESEIVADAEVLAVAKDVHFPVARTGHLIALKLLSRRDTRGRDSDDLRALVETADAIERERARAAVELIMARGYNRGRDLPALLAELLRGN